VPLTKIQTDILAALASNRNGGSLEAGAPPLALTSNRLSSGVARAASDDSARLEQLGFRVRWRTQLPNTIYTADVTRGEETTHLEWVFDSDFRFFPAVRDSLFGFVLHPVDLATNKAMAAVERREFRDLIDLLTIDTMILPLGAVVWAAVGKASGFTPPGLLAKIRRNLGFSPGDWEELSLREQLDPIVSIQELRQTLDRAEAFVAQMPSGRAGVLFLQNGRAVQPDPSRLDDYQVHTGQRGGHWPTSTEIENAMFDYHRGGR
jgi:hypothetical protein